MPLRVENRPVSRREFYGVMVSVFVFIFVALEAATSTNNGFRTTIEVLLVLTSFGALFEMLRTRA